MGRYDYDIGIIGGGAAGLTVAAGAGKLGAKALLLEKTSTLGGDCLKYGCVPSKAFIRAASMRRHAASALAYGLPAADLPPVDLNSVMERVASVVAKVGLHDSPERFRGMGVTVVNASPLFTGPTSVEWDGGKATAKNWVVATGSSPAIPPIPGLSEVPYLTNESVFSLKNLPESIIVLGGGPIGLELGQAFSRLGSRVTIVEALDRLFANDDREIGDALARALSGEGVRLVLGKRALRALKGEGGAIILEVGDAEGVVQERLIAAALLVATGRKPNLAGLALEKAGVNYSPKGLPTDSRMRTNVAHIYGCGDVNGRLLFTHVAGEQGRTVVANALLGIPRKFDPSLIGWCVYTSPEAAGVGICEAEAQRRGLAHSVIISPLDRCDREVIDGGSEGFIKLVVSPGGKLLGCRIVSERAGENIHEWLGVLKNGKTPSAVAGLTHVYPTYADHNGIAAGAYLERTLAKPFVKKLLKFIYGYSG